MNILDKGWILQAGGKQEPLRRFIDLVRKDMQKVGVTEEHTRERVEAGDLLWQPLKRPSEQVRRQFTEQLVSPAVT